MLKRIMLLLAAGTALTLQAQLNWNPEQGWHLTGEAGQTTLQPSRGLILLTMAREAAENGHNGLALRYYKDVYKTAGTSIYAPEAHFQASAIRMERKQWTKAFENLQAIVDNYPDYPGFEQVIDRQYEIADGLRRGNRLRLFWIIPGFKNPERAVEYFKKIVDNAPYSEKAPDSLLKAARLQSRDFSKLDDAIDLYDRFISEYPGDELVSDAYFGLAAAFSKRMGGPAYDQGANREAISYFEDFVLLYPDHPRAAEAEESILDMSEVLAESRVLLGDFYSRYRKNNTAARIFYNEAITLAPTSPTADEARGKLERLAEKEKQK